MEQKLQLFSESLAPSQEWLQLAREKINTIFVNLKQYSKKCRVDRCEIVGGMEKKTSTCFKVDVDAIVYYNDESGRIQMNVILSDWEDILLLKTNLEQKDIHKSRRLLTFVYDGIPIDLVAIRNKVQNTYKGMDVEKEQLRQELADESRKPSPNGKDLTLSGANLKWMKRRNKFPHDISRLTKYWSQTILFPHKVEGMSYIFEHIAVKAADEERREPPSYVETFKRFLVKVENIRSMKLIFTDEYQKSAIPLDVMRENPLILDCVNPYKNLLDLYDPTIKEKFFNVFSACAAESINRLRAIEINSRCDLEELFMIQPHLYNYTCEIVKPLTGSFLISTNDDVISQPKAEIREKLTDDEKKCMNTLLHVSAAMLQSAPDESRQTEAMEIGTRFVDMVMNKNSNWVSRNESHESKMCTLRLPIGNRKALYVSFDLDPSTRLIENN